MQFQRQKAKDEAAKAERERVAKEKARIKEQEDAQRRRQEAAASEPAQRRAQYCRSFRRANITPRGYVTDARSTSSPTTSTISVSTLLHPFLDAGLRPTLLVLDCCHCFPQDIYWYCGPCGDDCGNPDHPMVKMG